MPRLFSGIEIPAPICERLTMLEGGLEGARWIDPENFHLTLRFIGDVDMLQAREFAAGLMSIAAQRFDIQLDGLGSFGGRKPRAVWAGVAPCPALTTLQQAHERVARAAGVAPESRNFVPHVTLARLRRVRAEAVARYLEQNGGFATSRFEVARFVLYSSRQSIGGGPYVVEEAFPLAM